MKRWLIGTLAVLCLLLPCYTEAATLGIVWHKDLGTPTRTAYTMQALRSRILSQFDGYITSVDFDKIQNDYDWARNQVGDDYYFDPRNYIDYWDCDYLMVIYMSYGRVDHTEFHKNDGSIYDIKDIDTSNTTRVYVKGRKNYQVVSAGKAIHNFRGTLQEAVEQSFLEGIEWNLEQFGKSNVPFEYDKYAQERYRKMHGGNYSESL